MNKFVYLDNETLEKCWDGDISYLVNMLRNGFIALRRGEIILPEKISQIINASNQSRVNCMPCTVPELGISGVKLVSVFPDNPAKGLPNVMGEILLLSAEDGRPLAVLDAGFITSLRTALVGGLAATELAVGSPKKIALIGSGEQAVMHLLVFSYLFPSLTECAVASRSSVGERRFLKRVNGQIPNMNIELCNSNYEAAAQDTDIIVTAISGQDPILRADWIKKGAFYCHVGGLEDEYGVALKADKIVCDSWSDLKHRGSPTIAHMYRDGLLGDDDIYAELTEILSGEKPGRESDDEFIYFNSIGMAFTDMYVSHAMYQACLANHDGEILESRSVEVLENEFLQTKLRRIR